MDAGQLRLVEGSDTMLLSKIGGDEIELMIKQLILTRFYKHFKVINNGLNIACWFLMFLQPLVGHCLVVEYGDDEISIDGFAATGSIFQVFFALVKKHEGEYIIWVLNLQDALVVEFIHPI